MMNKNLPTKLFLNGPELSFSTQPQQAEISLAGVVTVTGVCTAVFPTQTPENPGVSDGSFEFDWYYDNTKLTDGGNISIQTVGTASTLTITGLSTTDDNKEIYAIADYIPTAYSQPTGSDVVAGTARSTGNPFNDLLKSDSVFTRISSVIRIVAQPEDFIEAAGFPHNYSIDAVIDVSDYFSDGGVQGAPSALNYQWQINETDLVEGTSDQSIDGTIVTLTSTGTQGPNLTITSNQSPVVANIRCVLTANNVAESPVISDTVVFNNKIPGEVLVFEAYDTTSTAITSQHILYTNKANDVKLEARSRNVDKNNPIEISQDVPNGPDIDKEFDSDDICFYAREKNVYVEVELYASVGLSAGLNGEGKGGYGGYSRIRFVAEKNQEYILRGLKSKSALFLYRQASLMAVVGQGGNGGSRNATSKGGMGGGVNQSGENGKGTTGAPGGQIPAEGSLGENGVWGSRANPPEIYNEDSQADSGKPGRTIKCSKGVYWRDQGISPCSLNSNEKTKYRLADGTEVTNSAEIDRGFKPGYVINGTGGSGRDGGKKHGKGGNGAVGGSGDTTGNDGGGGGSGYSDGSFLTMESIAGENRHRSHAYIRLADASDEFLDEIGFNVTRDAFFDNTITFEIEQGVGESPITFGPEGGEKIISVERGIIQYTLVSNTGQLRINEGRLELEDSNDNDWNDLQVTPNIGSFFIGDDGKVKYRIDNTFIG